MINLGNVGIVVKIRPFCCLCLVTYIPNLQTHIPDEHEICYPVLSTFLSGKIFSDLCWKYRLKNILVYRESAPYSCLPLTSSWMHLQIILKFTKLFPLIKSTPAQHSMYNISILCFLRHFLVFVSRRRRM